MVTGQGAKDAGTGFQAGLGAGHHGAADARLEGHQHAPPMDRVPAGPFVFQPVPPASISTLGRKRPGIPDATGVQRCHSAQ
jgi:hypothetical protein